MKANNGKFEQRAALAVLKDAGEILLFCGVRIPGESMLVERQRVFDWIVGDGDYALPFDSACIVASGEPNIDISFMRHAFLTRTRGLIADRILAKKPSRKAPRFSAPEPSPASLQSAWWRRVYRRDGIVSTYAANVEQAIAWIGEGIAQYHDKGVTR